MMLVLRMTVELADRLTYRKSPCFEIMAMSLAWEDSGSRDLCHQLALEGTAGVRAFTDIGESVHCSGSLTKSNDTTDSSQYSYRDKLESRRYCW